MLSIIGGIGDTGPRMTFDDMIGPDGITQVPMHGQHGVAFVESAYDSQASVFHTGFSSITITPQAGYGFTAGDFKLDQLDSLASSVGPVTFPGMDQLGNTTTATLSIGQNGQQSYNFYTLDGEVVESLTITVPTTDLPRDIKQVSVDMVAEAPIPEPSSLWLLTGVLGFWLMQRARRRSPR